MGNRTTQANLNRALKAAQKLGAHAVELLPTGIVRIVARPPAEPAAKADDGAAALAEWEAKRGRRLPSA